MSLLARKLANSPFQSLAMADTSLRARKWDRTRIPSRNAVQLTRTKQRKEEENKCKKCKYRKEPHCERGDISVQSEKTRCFWRAEGVEGTLTFFSSSLCAAGGLARQLQDPGSGAKKVCSLKVNSRWGANPRTFRGVPNSGSPRLEGVPVTYQS